MAIPSPEPGPDPLPPDVVAWRRVRVDADACAAGRTWLSPDERSRADALAHPAVRARFEAGRGALRSWLGHLTGIPPGEVPIVVGPHGKPALNPGFPGGLEFNVSHAGDLILLTVARHRATGIDLEPLRPAAELRRVAKRWFAAGEADSLGRRTGTEFDRAFFRLWTRKEAWLKARGTGIAGGLGEHEVGDDPAPGIRRVVDPEGAPWTIVDLPLPDGWVGALAASGTGWRPVEHADRTGDDDDGRCACATPVTPQNPGP